MLSPKLTAELEFWEQERFQYLHWYNGQIRELYFARSPSESQKVREEDDDLQNAIATWIMADWDRYLRHLLVDESYLTNKRVLDVGSGPLGLVRCFDKAQWFAIDPLAAHYKSVGYPTDRQGIKYFTGCVEDESTVGGQKFDAIVSVNAIDHVDDFASAIHNIESWLEPWGIVRIEVHYHEPTITEPVALNDDMVRSSFRKFKVEKVSDIRFQEFYPGFNSKAERLAVWSNDCRVTPRSRFPKWRA